MRCCGPTPLALLLCMTRLLLRASPTRTSPHRVRVSLFPPLQHRCPRPIHNHQLTPLMRRAGVVCVHDCVHDWVCYVVASPHVCVVCASVAVKPLPQACARFSLRGPTAMAVLRKALRLPAGDATSHGRLWRNIASLSSPAVLQSGTVLGLEVGDYREPGHDGPVAAPSSSSSSSSSSPSSSRSDDAQHERHHRWLTSWPGHASQCDGLWGALINGTTVPMRSHASVNKERAKCNAAAAVFREAPPTTSTRIPLLLIQAPGMRNGFGCGWDVVMPAECGAVMWASLCLAGGRVVRGCASVQPRPAHRALACLMLPCVFSSVWRSFAMSPWSVTS